MTTFFYTSNSIGVGHRIVPSIGDAYVITEGVTIGSTDSAAIYANLATPTVGTVSFIIEGSVFGDLYAIGLINSEATFNVDLLISSTGLVAGTENDGIFLGSYFHPGGEVGIRNHGIISAPEVAVGISAFDRFSLINTGEITGQGNAGNSTIGSSAATTIISNSGTISVGTTATAISVFGGENSEIVDSFDMHNTGVLTSPLNAIRSYFQNDHVINEGVIIGHVDLGYFESLDFERYDDILDNSGSISGDVLLGGGNDTLLGEAGEIHGLIDGGTGDDVIHSGLADDMIIGGAGADEIWGGAGNDTASYEGSADGVRVSLNRGAGWYGDAAGDTLRDIENLIGSARQDHLVGNSAANMLDGGNADDILSGLSGNDILSGGNGEDNILGGSGNDLISGDRHQDRLTGGDGEDIFAFLNILDSGPANTERDNITDFTQGQDLIDLTALGDLFFGGTAFSGSAGEIIYYHVAGGTRTVVEIDTDGDTVADFGILLSNAAHTMTAADFLFV